MEQKKIRSLAWMMALLLLLSACGGTKQAPVSPADTTVAAEPDVSAGEEKAAAPVDSPADRISSIEEAGAYLQSVGEFDQPVDACKLFVDLVSGNYDEVGLIHLRRWDNYYCLAYVREGETFYPVDPFILANGGEGWFADPKYNCASSTDLAALCDTLRETFPYNGENNPMESWEIEVLPGDAGQEETTKPELSISEENLLVYLTTPQSS